MKKAVYLLIISILFLSTATVYAKAPEVPQAKAYILVDSKTKTILAERNSNQRLFPASTTKIMTAIIALEKGKLDQPMTASFAAVNEIGRGGMNIGIMADEVLPMEDLLHALLISSANETANIIAENIAPSRKEFVDIMNQKAKDLGAVNTNFVNPCGSHNSNHYSTASDMAIIAQYAMTIPKFREIVAKKDYKIADTEKHKTWWKLPITNKLLFYTSSLFSQVTGIKTGFTNEAGNNLLSAASNDKGMELISVVMGLKGASSGREIFTSSKELLEYGFSNFSVQNVIEKNQFVKQAQITGSKKKALGVVASNNFSIPLPSDRNSWDITSKEHINSLIKAPVKAGDNIGYIEYFQKDILIGKVDVVASEDAKLTLINSISKFFTTNIVGRFIKNIFLFVFWTLVSFIALRIVLRKVSRHINAK